MCLSALHAARTNKYPNNPEKPGNQFRQGITLISVKVLEKKSEEMGSGDQTPSALQQTKQRHEGPQRAHSKLP